MARGLKLGEIGRYATTGRGALTFGVTTAMVFCRSREGLESPDLQLLFTPGSYDPNGTGRLKREPGTTLVVCLARPDSRWTIMARSADPLAARRSVRTICRQRATCAPYSPGPLSPGGSSPPRRWRATARRKRCRGADIQSEEALTAVLCEAGTNLHHPVRTFPMGEDPMAVVDPRLRVHGISGLRVIDASVMPP
jgi:choline dehydrogenase